MGRMWPPSDFSHRAYLSPPIPHASGVDATAIPATLSPARARLSGETPAEAPTTTTTTTAPPRTDPGPGAHRADICESYERTDVDAAAVDAGSGC